MSRRPEDLRPYVALGCLAMVLSTLLVMLVVAALTRRARAVVRADVVEDPVCEYEAACARRWEAPCPTCLHGGCEERGDDAP